MRKIKVLHVIPNLKMGGAEKFVLELSTELKRNRVNVKIISLYNEVDKNFREIIEMNNLDIIYLDKKAGIDFKIIMNLIKLVRQERPDVIHTHLYIAPYILPAKIIGRVPRHIHTVHSVANKELGQRLKKIMKIMYKYFGSTPVAISDFIKLTIEKEYNIGMANIPCIYNFVDLLKFKNKESIDVEDKFRFIHVGRMVEVKNHKLLIDAFAEVENKIGNCELILIGDGKLKEDIENQIKILGIKEKVKVLGNRNNVEEELNRANVFVLTSNYEGVPLSVLEAMASGLPIISTRAGGVVDIIEHDKNGIIIEIGDKEQLIKEMIEIYFNKDKRKKIVLEGLERVKKYDKKIICKKYIELYEKEFKCID